MKKSFKDPKKTSIQKKSNLRRQWNGKEWIPKKKVYLEKKKINDDWFEKAKNIKKFTPISVFIQKMFENAKGKKEPLPKMAEISKHWKKLKASEKKKYRKYTEEINEEREKLRDIYELINGIKPKKPSGAFRIFLQEKAKEKTFHSIKEGFKLWNSLDEDQKEEYLKKAHRCVLAYTLKYLIIFEIIRKGN